LVFYEFARNMTLDETRDVVRRHNEALGVTAFIEADRGDIVLFNYVVSFDGSFPDLTGDPVRDREIAIIRECRGITFDKESGQVVARKFHKFFNVGQREESQAHAIDWTQPHVILSKADGSMITPYRRRDGQIEWHTKMGRTDVAEPVNEFASRHPKFEALAKDMIYTAKTPIFEWVSRKQKIVIDYPVDDMILLAVRDNLTGEYMHYDDLVRLGTVHGITVIGHVEGSVTDVQVFLEAARILEGEEGYVVRFDNGHMAKVKAEDYLRLHNMVDMLQLEKNVLELVLSGSLDDAKPLMTDDSRERVERYLEAVERGAAAYAARLQSYVDAAMADVEGDRKRFAVEKVNIDNSFPARDRAFMFRIASGGNAVDVILDHVRKNTGTGTKVDEIRDLIGGARWEDFRDQSIVIED
jgi:RNA ligase